MALFQALVIGLLALIITPGYLFYFDVMPKVVLLLAGTAVALVGWGLLPRARGHVYSLFSLLLFLDVVSLAISTALSSNPGLSAFGTNWRRYGSAIQAAVLLFAWLIATHTAGHRERVLAILRTVSVAGGLSAAYGICQYFGWDPLLPASGYHIGEGVWTIVRPPGTMGYVSYFATWLLFVGFLSMALVAIETIGAWRIGAYVSAGLATVAMFLTGTRAAVAGLAAGLVFGLILALRRRRSSGQPAKRRPFRIPAAVWIGVAVLALGGVGFYYSPVGRQMRSRTRWYIEDPWGGNRPALWRDTLRMSAARLAAGYGPEVYTAEFPQFESKALARAYPDFLHESPHNIFLDALVAQGIPGLVILCGLCYLGLRVRREREAKDEWIAAAFAAGLVSQQFTVFTLPTALIFFVTAALAVGLRSEPKERPENWAYHLAAAPVALALLFLAVRFGASDHALAQAKRSVEAGNLPAAMARYEQYRRWNLPGATSDLWYSRALLSLAQSTADFTTRYQAVGQAGIAATRATKTAEDPFNAWYNLAALYASQNDSPRTERSLRSAIAANPNWFKPHWALAQVLRLQGHLDEAEREATTAADLDGGKDAEVTQTLAEIRTQLAQAKTPEQ